MKSEKVRMYSLFRPMSIHFMGETFRKFDFLILDFSKALLEMGRVEESIVRHKLEVGAAKRSGIDELKIRAMDNLAVSFSSFLAYMTSFSCRVTS